MRRLTSLLIAVLIFVTPLSASAQSAGYQDASRAAEEIHIWQLETIGTNEQLSARAGENVCDWLVFSNARSGAGQNGDYPAAAFRYFEENKGSLSLPDAERLSVCAASAGGDIISAGMLDDVFSRLGEDTSSALINHLIFALLALDSGRYSVPESSKVGREEIVNEILSRQLDSGALWMLNEKTSETDVTAMAVTALSPYVNGSPEVRSSVLKMVGYIASCVTDDGTVVNWGAPSCETTAQTIVALCSLGIDPATDERFVRGGISPLDGLLSYKQPDGGFAHNEQSSGSDPYATAQAYYALCAFARFKSGLRTLFDLRTEQPSDLRRSVDSLERDIAALETQDTASASKLLSDYASLPSGERMYVRNAAVLFDVLDANGIENTSLYSPDSIASDEGAAACTANVFDNTANGEQTITAADGNYSRLDPPSSTSPATSSARGHSPAEIVILLLIAAAAAGAIVFNHTVLKKSLRNNGR